MLQFKFMETVTIPPFGNILICDWEFDFYNHATHLVAIHPKESDLPEIQIHR